MASSGLFRLCMTVVEVLGQERETHGTDPRDKQGLQVHGASADPVRHTGEDDLRDRVSQLEPTGDSAGLNGGHTPFSFEERKSGCISHEDKTVADPRRAEPS